jgi:hypothetical protein
MMDKDSLSTLVDTINSLKIRQQEISDQAGSLSDYMMVVIAGMKETQDVLLDYNLRLDQLEKAQTQQGENDEQE